MIELLQAGLLAWVWSLPILETDSGVENFQPYRIRHPYSYGDSVGMIVEQFHRTSLLIPDVNRKPATATKIGEKKKAASEKRLMYGKYFTATLFFGFAAFTHNGVKSVVCFGNKAQQGVVVLIGFNAFFDRGATDNQLLEGLGGFLLFESVGYR
jgi:hypothetical protein